MRLSLLIIITCTLSLSAATTYSQQAKLSLSLRDVSIQDLLQEIGKKSDFSFWYSNNELNANYKITLAMKDQTIDKILDIALKGQNLAYEINDKIIVIYKQKDTNSVQQQKVKGTITDATTGEPIIGANVVIEGTTIGTITDINGAFSLDIPSTNVQLVVSYIGYNTEKVQYTGQGTLDIKLVPDVTKLDEIVVVGYGTKKKKDIIGSVSSISSNDINQLPVATIDAGLQGRGAGLQVLSSGGTPGAPPEFLFVVPTPYH
ncbi:MAG: hypothetical protein HC905_00935 [Bacteroidales bacterium]|nr:hypothetical protein [Bacteroidales bacterium]